MTYVPGVIVGSVAAGDRVHLTQKPVEVPPSARASRPSWRSCVRPIRRQWLDRRRCDQGGATLCRVRTGRRHRDVGAPSLFDMEVS